MAKVETPLRAPEADLSKSRQLFIQTLENKRLFEQECSLIIPELERLWEEKIIDTFNLNKVYPDLIRERNEAIPPETEGVTMIGPDHWKHYLFNYSPQLLQKAITRLASRLRVDTDGVFGTVKNARGVVENIPAYYKALVQELRKKELKRQGLWCQGAWPQLKIAVVDENSGLVLERRTIDQNGPGERWENCICLQDEHHRDCPAIKTGKCHYQSYYTGQTP